MTETHLADIQQLLGGLPDGLWCAELLSSERTFGDTDLIHGWRYIFTSAALARIAGMSPGKFREGPHQFWQMVPPLARPDLFNCLCDFFHSDEPSLDLEYRIRTPEGTGRHIHERIAVKRGDVGQPVQLTGVVRDVTGMKRAETALRDNEARLSRIVRTSPNGIVNLDRGGTVKFVNPAARRILGMTTEQLTGAEWSSLPFQKPIPLPGTTGEGVLSNSTSSQAYEEVLYRPDGKRVTLSVWVALMSGDDRDSGGYVVTFTDVTERWRAEEARRVSESRLSRIVETITDGILMVDGNYRITFANNAAERIFGRVRRELTAECWYKLPWRAAPQPERDDPASSVEAIHQIVLKEGRSITGQERIVRPRLFPGDVPHGEGHSEPAALRVSTSFVPLHDAWGNVVSMIISFTDITERTRFEQKLEQGEQRFRALVEKSTDGVLLTDESGNIVYSSSSTPRLLGYENAALRGRSALDLVHPEDREEVLDNSAKILGTHGEPVTSQIRCRHRDGSWRLLEVTGCNRLEDSSVRAVVLNYRDVTELESQHALLTALVNSAPDPIFYKSKEGIYLGCNRAFEAFVGMPEEELLGRADEGLFTDGRDLFWAEDERGVLTDRTPRRVEGWLRYPDETKAFLEMLLTPLNGSDGRLQGVIGIGRDLTERRQLEEHLRHAGKMEAIGQLAGAGLAG